MLFKRYNTAILITVILLSILGVWMLKGNMLEDRDLNFIREVEGFNREAYQDEGGVWTIGYGHTREVKEGDTISTHKANLYLNTDLIIFEIQLQKLLRVKQIEDNKGKTLVSEGIDANYFDMVNYAIFALIHLELE